LKDPAGDRTLTLIGTTNSSTTLAYRTRNLLEELKPDAVYVQTSRDWWQYAKQTEVELMVFRSITKRSSVKPARISLNPSTSSKIT
ncbi:MAG: hypothetical protein KDD45_07935, partial [Bdellovibrionales bacterium]|nr:hypothetical protein [Bdellovibrionales bacterium]